MEYLVPGLVCVAPPRHNGSCYRLIFGRPGHFPWPGVEIKTNTRKQKGRRRGRGWGDGAAVVTELSQRSHEIMQTRRLDQSAGVFSDAS